MAKNSTLSSNAPFISPGEKNLKAKASLHNTIFPGDAVVANILNYSKALKVEKSRQLGLIEMVQN